MLPDWPPGTVTILSTGGGAPHAIPVSTALRAGPQTIVIGLANRRESLARLREDPRCALTVLAEGDVAFTAYASATILDEVVGGVTGVRLDVLEVQDHGQPTFVIDGGVRWRWTDDDAAGRDAELRAALERLA
jgi:Pyridoxamine 5'-phosphate oxidase